MNQATRTCSTLCAFFLAMLSIFFCLAWSCSAEKRLGFRIFHFNVCCLRRKKFAAPNGWRMLGTGQDAEVSNAREAQVTKGEARRR